MPRDCLIETALAEETRLEAKLLNDTEIELYKVFVLFVEISRSAALKWPRCEPFLFGCLFTKSKQHQMSIMTKFGHTASDFGYDFCAPNYFCNIFWDTL